MRRLLRVMPLILLVVGRQAGAQFGSMSDDTPPRWFGSAWGGFQFGGFVPDDESNATWDFDTNWQVRGTLERELGSRVGVGIAFSYAGVALSYTSNARASCTDFGGY